MGKNRWVTRITIIQLEVLVFSKNLATKVITENKMFTPLEEMESVMRLEILYNDLLWAQEEREAQQSFKEGFFSSLEDVLPDVDCKEFARMPQVQFIMDDAAHLDNFKDCFESNSSLYDVADMLLGVESCFGAFEDHDLHVRQKFGSNLDEQKIIMQCLSPKSLYTAFQSEKTSQNVKCDNSKALLGFERDWNDLWFDQGTSPLLEGKTQFKPQTPKRAPLCQEESFNKYRSLQKCQAGASKRGRSNYGLKPLKMEHQATKEARKRTLNFDDKENIFPNIQITPKKRKLSIPTPLVPKKKTRTTQYGVSRSPAGVYSKTIDTWSPESVAEEVQKIINCSAPSRRTRSSREAERKAQQSALRDPDDDIITIGTYTRAERRANIARFHKKRLKRNYKKNHFVYHCRRKFANSRKRVGGKFVKG